MMETAKMMVLKSKVANAKRRCKRTTARPKQERPRDHSKEIGDARRQLPEIIDRFRHDYTRHRLIEVLPKDMTEGGSPRVLAALQGRGLAVRLLMLKEGPMRDLISLCNDVGLRVWFQEEPRIRDGSISTHSEGVFCYIGL